MKTIIALRNAAEKGKSSTLLILDTLIISKYSNESIVETSRGNNNSIDFHSIFKINKKIIALVSQGDPGTALEKRLEEIIKKYNPNVIFCACRTKGETLNTINSLTEKHNLNQIWSTTYEVTQNHTQANVLKAEHLLDLAIKMKFIPNVN